MRAFVALVPPEDALADLEAFLEPRREHGPFRWAAPDQLHVTLAFHESLPDHALDEYVDRLGSAVDRTPPSTVRLGGGGAFPHAGGAKVLWTGVRTEPDGVLTALATRVRHAAGVSGVPVDGRRFRPHLTLARLGRPAEVSKWVRLLDAYDGPAWPLAPLRLFASHLGEGPRRRPRYELLAELPFPGGPGRRA